MIVEAGKSNLQVEPAGWGPREELRQQFKTKGHLLQNSILLRRALQMIR